MIIHTRRLLINHLFIFCNQMSAVRTADAGGAGAEDALGDETRGFRGSLRHGGLGSHRSGNGLHALPSTGGTTTSRASYFSRRGHHALFVQKVRGTHPLCSEGWGTTPSSFSTCMQSSITNPICKSAITRPIYKSAVTRPIYKSEVTRPIKEPANTRRINKSAITRPIYTSL